MDSIERLQTLREAGFGRATIAAILGVEESDVVTAIKTADPADLALPSAGGDAAGPRVVAGVVANGSSTGKLRGDGFTVTSQTNYQTLVTFDEPFSEPPAITVWCEYANGGRVGLVSDEDLLAESISVKMRQGDWVSPDTGIFHFIAVGS